MSAPAPAPSCGVERLDDLGGLLGGRVPTGEVDHRAVVADRREVAAVGHPVRGQLQARGRPPRSAPARCGSGPGRTRGSTCCRRRCPGGMPGGITAARPTSPRAARRARFGIDATSSGVLPPRDVDREVRTPVRHAHDVLHRVSLAEASDRSRTRCASPEGELARVERLRAVGQHHVRPCRACGRRRAGAGGRRSRC